MNSNECAAAAANAPTDKAAVTAALALALFEFDCSFAWNILEPIEWNPSEHDICDQIPSSSGVGFPEGLWHIRAGFFVCSLSISYILELMLRPSAHENRTSLTHLCPSHSTHERLSA